jgi:hypothetical protein
LQLKWSGRDMYDQDLRAADPRRRGRPRIKNIS